MGHLLGAIGQKELDEQRGVVQNEKRQGENQPYGRVDERITAKAFPVNHPYHHDTIGSMKDLDAASLDDVKQWFATNYGAANITTRAGRRHHARCRESEVARIFRRHSGRPAGAAPAAVGCAAHRYPTRDDDDRSCRADAYLSRMERAVARRCGRNAARARGRGARRRQNIAPVRTGLSTRTSRRRCCGRGRVVRARESMVQLQVDVKQGVDPAKVEAAIAEEWSKFPQGRTDDDELARVKVDTRASVIRPHLEKVNGKASHSCRRTGLSRRSGRLQERSRERRSGDAGERACRGAKMALERRLHADRETPSARRRGRKTSR